jgi:hypothetical protein
MVISRKLMQSCTINGALQVSNCCVGVAEECFDNTRCCHLKFQGGMCLSCSLTEGRQTNGKLKN